jgi:chromosome segregation ATPase
LKVTKSYDYPHPDGPQIDNQKLKSLIALKDEAELNSIKMEQERHKAIQSAKALKIELKNVEMKLRQCRADNAKLETSMLQFVNGNDLVQSKIECLKEELERADKRVAQAERERAEWELRAAVAKAETRKNANQQESVIAELKAQQDTAADNVQQLQLSLEHLEAEIENAQNQHFETQSVLSAVQSSLTEREGEVALIKVQLSRQIQDHKTIIASEKKVHQTAIDRIQRQHDEEITHIRKLLSDQHASNTKRNQDIAYLQNARHIHMLEDKVKELEYAMTITCQQHEEKIAILERRLTREHSEAAEAIERWEKKERAWQMQAAGVEAEYWRRDSKIKEMEQEVVRLYSKNLELIKELAKWTP